MQSPRARLLIATFIAFGVTACSSTGTEPEARSLTPGEASHDAVKFWEVNATADWNERATSLASRRTINAGRLYAYLSLAQLRAAQDAQSILPHPPNAAAIGAASASVLDAFFPSDIVEIEGALDALEGATPWPGAQHADWATGEAIGRAAAARILAYSTSDLFGLTSPGIPPQGPGLWVWTSGPIARGGLGARPFFLASGDEFRSPPPPAFGSAEFTAALAEVRQISDTRTAAQLATAIWWNANQSPTSSAATNNVAVSLIRRYRRSDLEAARILFLMNAATFDAIVGCFDAKYHYWYVRPPQADPQITLPIGLPPHPSYPSAHSCGSGASFEVLADEFPNERTNMEQLAEEASLSRLYAGIHFRFDMVAGLALGRAVADKARAADLDAVAVR